MRNINNIDPSSSVRHEHSTRTPSKDFARELAKPGDERAQNPSDKRDSTLSAPVPVTQGVGSKAPNTLAPAFSTSDGKAGSPVSEVNPLAPANASGVSLAPGAPGVSVPAPSVLQNGAASAPNTGLASGLLNEQLASNSKTLLPSAGEGDTTLGSFEWTAVQAQLSAVVQPTGVTEALLGSRVYGVHLFASTYLSELNTSGQDVSDLAYESAPNIVSGSVASEPYTTTNNDSIIRESEFPSSQQNDIVAALALLADDGDSVSIANPHPVGTVSEANAEASTALWPESSMRLTKQRDGSTVIWLRDYRADSDDASRLVDAVVKGANDKGMRLARIVLNGREVWTSRDNH